MKKILRIKVGTAYIDGKNVDVFQDAREKISKGGKLYYEITTPIFVNEVKSEEPEQQPLGA